MKSIILIIASLCFFQVNAQETKATERNAQPQVVELKSVLISNATQQGTTEASTAIPIATSKSSEPTEGVELRSVESKREDD